VDIQVQELIEKIKRDGIESAAEEAGKIKRDAEAEARRIVEAAKKEAEQTVENARRDADAMEKAALTTLDHASRNLLLAFRSEVQGLLNRIVLEQVNEDFGDEVLKKALPDAIAAWDPGKQGSIEALLSEDSLARLQAFFAAKLAEQLKKGLELRSDPNLSAGFKIASKDGLAYYDFSAESVAGMLGAYLSPKLAEILKAAAKAPAKAA